MLAINAHAEYCLKYVIASCCLRTTDYNVNAHANIRALFLSMLCPLDQEGEEEKRCT